MLAVATPGKLFSGLVSDNIVEKNLFTYEYFPHERPPVSKNKNPMHIPAPETGTLLKSAYINKIELSAWRLCMPECAERGKYESGNRMGRGRNRIYVFDDCCRRKRGIHF